MKLDCGCCEGIQSLTPRPTTNRPGLEALTYRVGTHRSFLQSMLAQLSSQERPALARLKTRLPEDFSIALLDAWATVADVLTFYQERIVNEGYLRTATERRSILELARLVGYELRPGVSASVYLAFTMEPDFNNEQVFIPAGTQAQSVPQPEELPQTFETETDEPARTDWNQLQPRLTRPQYLTNSNLSQKSELYVAGITSNLEANDRLLFVFENNTSHEVRVVESAEIRASDQRTRVTLLPTDTPVDTSRSRSSGSVDTPIRAIGPRQIRELIKPPTLPPRNPLRLTRSTAQTFSPGTDFAPKLLTKLLPSLKSSFYTALRNTPVTASAALESSHKFAVKASPFGHNAPLKIIYDEEGRPDGFEEWGLETQVFGLEADIRDTTDSSARVYMMEQGRLFSGEIALPSDESEFPQSITLDNGVRVTLQQSEPGVEPRDQIIFVFESVSGVELKQISIAPGTSTSVRGTELLSLAAVVVDTASFSVQVDDDVRQTIDLRRRVRYGRGNRQVQMSINQNALLSVRDRVEGAAVVNNRNVIALESQYDKVVPNSWVLLERPQSGTQVFQVQAVQTVSIARYGITGKVTQLVLNDNWLTDSDRSLSDIRDVTVYAQSEPLELTEAVIDPVKESIKGDEIELSALYGGLEAGRWLIVCGERTDIPNTTGVRACELVMLAAVRQAVAPIPEDELGQANEFADPTLPGDTTHSFLQLATPLKYEYRRDTAIIYGNVVKATHGETREEVLGSGDAAVPFQSFVLRQPPLTFISAPTPSGIESTLAVRINQVEWHEVDSLGQAGAGDRVFTSRQDNDGNTLLTFGDGQRGLRLPTGIENVRAKYRSGIGKAGNVRAEQISLLASRPLGVREVINPLAASGGADAESRDQARLNAPLAVMALDRLVSLQDYEDFARTFAGVGKAQAVQLTDGRRQVIHLTIAGEDDIPITPTSDLYRNLKQALQTFGSPNRWVQIDVRDLMVLIIAAKVRLRPDYAWEFVGPQVRTKLLETFSFQRRALGQDVQSSEVLAAMHQVPGVDSVDLDVLTSLAESEVVIDPSADNETDWLDKLAAIAESESTEPSPLRLDVELGRVDPTARFTLLPAQLAILSPDVPDTLKLEVLTP